jgi:hypothetical protein
MPKIKNLPKGLAEFEATLGDLQFTDELLKRLLDLPENGLSSDLAAFRDAMKVVEQAELAAANARKVARRVAGRMWDAARRNWSIEELQAATGYDEE